MTANTLVACGAGVRLERGEACRMPDGIVLRSDHYYPPGEGPHPTLLMRQPYGRDIASTVVYAHPVWFARQGYNVVIQDVRGRGGSDGEFYPFRHERLDGAATIHWLRSRPESNGRIGMYGFSYQGLTQLLAAAEAPEGLQCIAPWMTACNLFEGWFYHNGALRLASSLGWGLQMLKADARRLRLREASNLLEDAWIHLRDQPLQAPYGMHPAILADELPSYVRDWFDQDRPGDYWSRLDVSTSLADIKIPALHLSGWFDTYLNGSIDGYLGLCNSAGSDHARAHQYLLAGPWIHIPWGDQIGDQNFGVQAMLDTDSLLLRWFNHWLKDSGEFDAEPKIRHFALGANQWFQSDRWSSTETLALYLHSAGRANARKGDGSLLPQTPSKSEQPDVFVYDPEVPVYAPGGATALGGAANQAALEMGNNLLVYTSVPLSEPVQIFGHPRVTLFCTTSAAHADFTAKLVRVTSAGRAEFICIGIARSSYLFRDTGYAPDTVHCWHFEMEPTSCVFSPGESIRLEIASSAFPLYDRNPSTAVKASRADSWNWSRSTQALFHDPDRASVLHLPVGQWKAC